MRRAVREILLIWAVVAVACVPLCGHWGFLQSALTCLAAGLTACLPVWAFYRVLRFAIGH